MISRLKGILLHAEPPFILVDVNGVGYEVEAPVSTFARLPKAGQEVILYTHLIVREDAHVLCGFSDLDTRELFRNLIKVNGVGPKLALAILSGMQPHELVRSVRENDLAALTRISGVGKKTAERLIIELRDRIEAWQEFFPAASRQGSSSPSTTAMQEAHSALVALGYKPQEATRLLQQVDASGKNSELLIRESLKLAATR